MYSFLVFLAKTIVYGLVAIVAHELAHVAAAILVRRRIAHVNWRSLDVYWHLPSAGPSWRDYVIGWAPLLSGALLALTAILTGTTLSVPMWVALAFYALHGGTDDLYISTAGERDAAGAGKT